MLHFVSTDRVLHDQLLKLFQDKLPGLTKIEVEEHFYIKTKKQLSGVTQQKLQKILGDVDEFDCYINPIKVIVTPRVGTISPWSSKAADILRVSGIYVERMEKAKTFYFYGDNLIQDEVNEHLDLLHDRMTESIFIDFDPQKNLFQNVKSRSVRKIDLSEDGIEAIHKVNAEYGLALSDSDIDYLHSNYQKLQRNPTLTELMMFGQVNSEHCRHKIFNATWNIDGVAQDKSLFAMIKNTYEQNNKGVLSAYHDNGAVIEGCDAAYFFINAHNQYQYSVEPIHTVIKVETHNHPTAIEPFSGAATGAGGEIRDEGAVGIGSKPKAGMAGFSVSNLRIPGFKQQWEKPYPKPDHIASPLDIMIKGPMGAASFNNEFGRPNICGYFRVFEQEFAGAMRGYHKPIMIAGGLGSIRANNIRKNTIQPKMKLIVLGGPAMQIGLGGGAASSMHATDNNTELDFASVQRSNPEMQRRCQQVINACVALGEDNPLVSIHDVGAGGLCNAMPELVNDSDCGGEFQLRAIDNAEASMSPMAIWCNESQERYVLAIDQASTEQFTAIAERERCPFSIIGEALEDQQLTLIDEEFQEQVIDLPMSVLFHNAPKLHRNGKNTALNQAHYDSQKVDLNDAVDRVLHHPTCASKQFLITIGDRSVTGLVARDQMVGPWQVPVADVAVTTNSFQSYTGEAMAMGERPPLALLDAQAAARIAVGEAVTNIIAADVQQLSDIKLSANWMAAAGDEIEEAKLYAAVKAVGEEFCPALGLTIPVGKDSLSMRMKWQENGQQKSVTSPLSLVISAFSRVQDVRKTMTPQLQNVAGSELWLIDLGAGKNRLGASILTQVYNDLGNTPVDVEPETLANFVKLINAQRDNILAYHDRSDGGVLITLFEMVFASHLGIDITMNSDDPVRALFTEELGAVVQISGENISLFQQAAETLGLTAHKIAHLNGQSMINVINNDQNIFSQKYYLLQRAWSETSYRIQSLRDNPKCATEEYEQLLNTNDPGLFAQVNFALDSVPDIQTNSARPKVAILREQGVNGHVEMAAAFYTAGFECVDVHMTDIIAGRISLSGFVGLAVCGGFSYGDVMGAGRGWASSVLHNSRARDEFVAFFERKDTFTLGVCNGCQMLASIKELIPGTDHWPQFVRNTSNQFEARLVMVEIDSSPSILFDKMAGSKIPVVVAHGEGRIEHSNPHSIIDSQLSTLRYLNQQYPNNPNGSPLGITGLCNADGRVNIMMPHPERIFRSVQFSWHPQDWSEYSPWMQLFLNARKWCE